MKNKLFERFRSKIRIKITGKNVDKFIHKLVISKIELLDIKKIRKDIVYLWIYKEDYKKIYDIKTTYKKNITYIILGGIMINNITVEGLKNDINRYTVIDLRRIESYNNGNISMSKNIPFNQLIIEPNKYLKKDILYCLYCQKGSKSIKACQILQRQGYKVYNLIGGYEAWILAK